MRIHLRAVAIGLLLGLAAAPAIADEAGDAQAGVGRAVGCAFALSATTGMPGWVFVQAACDQPADESQVADDQATPSADGAAAAVQGVTTGCAIAIVQTANTPGAPYVQAACQRAVSAVQAGVAGAQPAVVAPIPPPPVNGRAIGCARAIAATSGTMGAPFVRAHCGQPS